MMNAGLGFVRRSNHGNDDVLEHEIFLEVELSLPYVQEELDSMDQ